MGGSINTMILGGLALVFSRLIDNGVIVLENIFRTWRWGIAAGCSGAGGTEVSMAVLAATFTTSIVFFPVTFFSGISKYIFTPLALGVVLSIFASYFFAMTVVPLYCAKFIRLHDGDVEGKISAELLHALREQVQREVPAMLNWYEGLAMRAMSGPALRRGDPRRRGAAAVGTVPFLGRAYFPAHRPRPVRHRRAHAQRHAVWK
jgi:multidrug efflux pump subunit AcrB